MSLFNLNEYYDGYGAEEDYIYLYEGYYDAEERPDSLLEISDELAMKVAQKRKERYDNAAMKYKSEGGSARKEWHNQLMKKSRLVRTLNNRALRYERKANNHQARAESLDRVGKNNPNYHRGEAMRSIGERQRSSLYNNRANMTRTAISRLSGTKIGYNK